MVNIYHSHGSNLLIWDDFSNLKHLGFPSLDLLFFHVFSNTITKNHESLDTVAKGMSIPGISIAPKGKGSTHKIKQRNGLILGF